MPHHKLPVTIVISLPSRLVLHSVSHLDPLGPVHGVAAPGAQLMEFLALAGDHYRQQDTDAQTPPQEPEGEQQAMRRAQARRLVDTGLCVVV